MHDPNPASGRTEREIFSAALERSTPEDRAAFLDEVCGADTALRRRIESLLARHFEPESFMKGPAIGEKPTILTQPPPAEQPGLLIARYKLLEKLGEGGFGAVWAAEQREPVKRRVALKIIKLGMDTKQVVARFEAERQALALMDHPNIAKVLDAGATDTGRPYFVMELVRGIPITQYCDQEKLPVQDRLDLFIKVCHAIQHAHQKGIIHRDIKPSNILVTLHDGVPVPKVIDFGIAKATQAELTELTIYTQHQQFIGTPAYMSPEQAEMSGLDIDTRSDIYSLGVLLYELLTGSTPFDTKDLMQSGVDEMRRIIREVEPMRPSTRLTQLEHAGRSQIANRKSKIENDLDWIVMKCLEKDRARRYETANGLAADLRRHLNNEPVVARPPSTLYQFRKAWRRNKVVYTAWMVVAAALVIGTAVSIWQAQRALTAGGEAESRRIAAEAAEKAAERARAEAQQAADDLLQHLYAADMRAAHQALQGNDLALATDLINKYLPYIPIGNLATSAGETSPMARARDLLGWEWRWLWQLCRSDELQTLQRSANAVRCVVLAPHGRLVATASDRSLRIMDRNSMQVIATLGGHQEFDDLIDTLAVAFSGDGEYLAAMGGTDVRVWRVGEWEAPFKRLEGLSNWNINSAVVFSPDSRTLVTRVRGGIGFWDTETWERTFLRAYEGFDLRLVSDWDMAGQGTNVVYIGRDAKALRFRIFEASGVKIVDRSWSRFPAGEWGDRLQDLNSRLADLWDEHDLTAAQKQRLLDDTIALLGHAPERLGTVMKYSRDGALLALDLLNYSNNSGDLQIRDAKTLALITHLVRPPWLTDRGTGVRVQSSGTGVRVQSVDFSDELLAVGHRDGELKLYDLASWAEVASVPAHRSSLRGLAFSPDGRTLATASATDRVIKLWDVPSLVGHTHTGQDAQPARQLRGHRGGVHALTFLPDGQELLSASVDGTVKTWSAAGSDEPDGLPDVFQALWFSPDGRRVMTANVHGTDLVLWDTLRRKQLDRAVPAEPGNDYRVGAVSDDGRWAALAAGNGVIDVWNLQTTQRVRQIDTGTSPPAFRMALSPDAKWLGVAPGSWQHATARDGLRLWNLESESSAPRFFREGFTPLTFCSDGRRVVYTRMDGMVAVADLHSGTVSVEWEAHPGRVLALALSPDNSLLATAGNDAVVRLWDMASYEEVARLKGHLDSVNVVAFAPDGKTMVTVTFDSDIKFWHIPTKRELFTVDQFRIVGYSARFSPNGEYLAVNGDDGQGQPQLMLWRAPSWEEIAAAEAKAESAPRN
jgi:eukaryotic-like serine/threonine-protein kinase